MPDSAVQQRDEMGAYLEELKQHPPGRWSLKWIFEIDQHRLCDHGEAVRPSEFEEPMSHEWKSLDEERAKKKLPQGKTIAQDSLVVALVFRLQHLLAEKLSGVDPSVEVTFHGMTVDSVGGPVQVGEIVDFLGRVMEYRAYGQGRLVSVRYEVREHYAASAYLSGVLHLLCSSKS